MGLPIYIVAVICVAGVICIMFIILMIRKHKTKTKTNQSSTRPAMENPMYESGRAFVNTNANITYNDQLPDPHPNLLANDTDTDTGSYISIDNAQENHYTNA